jgi:hypothetical protein
MECLEIGEKDAIKISEGRNTDALLMCQNPIASGHNARLARLMLDKSV